jgi:hypothetical protein
MKTVYIAHPISGNVENNLKSVERIARELTLADESAVPVAPYHLYLHCLDEGNIDERNEGINKQLCLIANGYVDEVLVCGGKITDGMLQEINAAHQNNVPVRIYEK